MNIKYDFAIAQSVQGGVVTFGELFSHSASFSEMSAICATFEKILGGDLFEAISTTKDRWEVKHGGASIRPIISDVPTLERNIGRLLEVRNILVHEMPDEKPFSPDEIPVYFGAASDFMHALEEHLGELIYPNSPMTQREMNIQAAKDHELAVEELTRLCAEIDAEYSTDELSVVQVLWDSYKDAEATRQAQMHLGGSIRPMLYSLAAASITRASIKELQHWREYPGG